MRLLYSVQRFGEELVGGSEAAALAFSEALVRRGHEVEVVTSCARSHADWANVYPPGTEEVRGVTVHRLPTRDIRRAERFDRLHHWVLSGPRPVPLFEQQRWAQMLGPDLPDLPGWIMANAPRFDAAVFMTYLYATTTTGLPVASGRLPTLFQPTAHDEPALRVPLFEFLFRQPDAFLFFTPEERELVHRRFGVEPAGETIGIGIDLTAPVDPASFRIQHGLGDTPYVLYVGRIDAMKGTHELIDFFGAFKQRRPSPLKLVMAGEVNGTPPHHPDVVHVGFLSEEAKRAALVESLALIQPSRFESFSLVLCEAWVQRRPALINAASAVMEGQALRSGGALPYRGFAEFEMALEMLVADEPLRRRLGEAGRAYVERQYRWDTVLDGFERAVELATERFSRRRRGTATPPRHSPPTSAAAGAAPRPAAG
jgi:glycosyltransferase involved in cell wall biosynthesis